MATDIEDLHRRFVTDLVTNHDFEDKKGYNSAMTKLRRKYHCQPRKTDMQDVYKDLLERGEVERHDAFEHFGIKYMVRSASGVLVVTVFTAQYFELRNGEKKRFDCAYDCHYCPDEPGQPRSYLSTEPGVKRANENDFDPVKQFDARMLQLVSCGHVPDKIEILVLGGTWSSYPMEYREDFIRDVYYAANTWLPDMVKDKGIKRARGPMELLTERQLNEVADARIIGITLETRPDCVNPTELQHFRRCGCTRVQLGIQHTDDAILKKINRRCNNRQNKRGIRYLKENGFKVDIHLMPDLPGSSIEKDWLMFLEVLNDEDLQVDQWKIYPTSVTNWTKIKEWYEAPDDDPDKYIPYAESDWDGFVDLLLRVKIAVHPWIRLNRVIRDIPNMSIIGGNPVTHLRDVLHKMLRDKGQRCRCIRCREIRDSRDIDPDKAELIVRQYRGNKGDEYYISFENPENNDALYGHLRLRFNDNLKNKVFPELTDAAMIRELHVYGKIVSVKDKEKYEKRAQHHGFGSRMLAKAEEITLARGLTKIAVISGDGVKPYYRKRGYRDVGEYLVKELKIKDSAEAEPEPFDDGSEMMTEALDEDLPVVEKTTRKAKSFFDEDSEEPSERTENLIKSKEDYYLSVEMCDLILRIILAIVFMLLGVIISLILEAMP